MESKSYHTIQKDKIYEILKDNSDKHLTADQMLEILREKDLDVSRATLYRYLDVLVLNGDLRKYATSNNSKACYQLIDDNECKSHFHLVCEKCGKLIHLSCDKVNKFIGHIEEEHNFEVNLSKVTFYGLCEDCKENK